MGRDDTTTPIKGTKSIEEEPTPALGMPRYQPGTEGRRPCLVALAGPRIGEVFVLTDPSGLLIGRTSNAGVRLLEEGVSRRHARLTLADGVVTLTDLDSTNGTWVGGTRVKTHPMADGDKIRVGQTTVLKFTYHDPLEEACQRQLLEAALRDGLTGVFNHRYFRQRLSAEMAYAERHHTPLGLLLIDLDHFKAVNDTFGHIVGDGALQKVAEILQSKIRIDDVLARYGGEEFAVITRDTSLEGALTLGERLRSAIADGLYKHQERPIELRVSVGAAAIPRDDVRDAERLIALADEALYRAKRGGRNRVSK